MAIRSVTRLLRTTDPIDCGHCQVIRRTSV